jgi:hypothetical protein
MRIEKHYSARYGRKGIPRSKNQTKSTAQMQKANELHAIKTLTDLINTNFGSGDMHIVLTYRSDLAPNPEDAKKQLDKFLRKARGIHRKQERELKYIAVTEYRNKRIHHHLIVNAIDAGLLQKAWEYGKLRPTYLDNRGDYEQLAKYLIKETAKTYAMEDAPQRQRYTCSKNLKRPEVHVKKQSARSWRPNPTIPKGYQLIDGSLYNGFDPMGYPIQEYRLLRIDRTPNQKMREKRGKK